MGDQGTCLGSFPDVLITKAQSRDEAAPALDAVQK